MWAKAHEIHVKCTKEIEDGAGQECPKDKKRGRVALVIKKQAKRRKRPPKHGHGPTRVQLPHLWLRARDIQNVPLSTCHGQRHRF